MSTHELNFGSLDLASGIAADAGYWFEVLADGFAPGSPQAVKSVIASLMRDGEDERIARYGNRTVTFRVAVRAPDSAALHQGEAALVAELGGRNTISWLPPDGYGGLTVYDVLNSTMDPEFDDMGLLRSPLEMVYSVTATCEPWPRSATLTTTTFVPSPPTVTTIDDATSATQWTSVGLGGYPRTAVTWLGESAIKFDLPTFGSSTATLRAKWTGTLSAAAFLAVDVAIADGAALSSLTLGTAEVQPVSTEVLASGFRRFYFVHPGAIAGPTFKITLTDNETATGPDVYVGGLYSTTSIPSVGVLVASVGGSVPTTGSVTFSRPSSPFQELMVYSDPSMLSHGFSPSETTTWQYAPQGRYLVYVYSENVVTSTTDITNDDVVVVTVTAGGRTQEVRTRAAFEGGFAWLPVGEVELGGNRDGLVGAITVAGTLNGGEMTTAQYRLFRMDSDTALIYARMDFGDGITEVVIDAPSVDFPQGGVWYEGADGLDQVDAWDFPILVPPATALWADAFGGGTTTVTLTHYEHWHTFAAGAS